MQEAMHSAASLLESQGTLPRMETPSMAVAEPLLPHLLMAGQEIFMRFMLPLDETQHGGVSSFQDALAVQVCQLSVTGLADL